MRRARAILAGLAITALALTACGGDADDPAQAGDGATTDEAPPAADDGAASQVEAGAADVALPVVAVTTNILGDVVGEIAAGQVEVVTIMPTGASPHDFQASAQQVDAMTSADALVVNGGGFEEGLLDVIGAAEDDGVPTYEAVSAVTTIAFGEAGHDHGDDEDEHGKDGHGDDEHDRDGVDPHFFTDPVRMADAVDALADWLTTTLTDVDADAIRAAADAYVAELELLDDEVTGLLAGVADEQRVLVTNHEVFGYFADRYGFEIVGAVVPGGSTTDTTSARQLAELAEVVAAEGVPAVFADTSSSDELAQALAAEVGGDVAVVELFTESLGEPGSGGATYLEMVRTNAQRIADALAA